MRDVASGQDRKGRKDRSARPTIGGSGILLLEEIRRLGAAFDALEKEGANRMPLDIARLWALTGWRWSEIEGLRWSEVDLPADDGRLLSELMRKSTRKRSLEGRQLV